MPQAVVKVAIGSRANMAAVVTSNVICAIKVNGREAAGLQALAE
jgi:hypothetical protein